MSTDCNPQFENDEHDIIIVQDFLQESLRSLEKMAETAQAAKLPQLARPLEELSQHCIELLQTLNRRVD